MIKVVIVNDANLEVALGALGNESVIQGVLSDVMTAARDKWVTLAGQRLHSTRRDYIDGIEEVEVDGLTASIALVGAIAHRIEEGVGAYDMHDTLLGPAVPVVAPGSGQKGKHDILDKDGKPTGKYWRVIPFRHQTPGSIGQGGGAPMGSAYSGHAAVENAGKLGKKIYAAAKKLGASTGMPGQKTNWGDRLPEGLAPKLAAHHTTDIYAGMVKLSKPYGDAGKSQNTYMTFRIITDNQPEKFLHPGTEGVHIVDEVEKYIEQVASAAFSALLAPSP